MKILIRLSDRWEATSGGDQEFYRLWGNKNLLVSIDEDRNIITFTGQTLEDSKRLRQSDYGTRKAWYDIISPADIVKHRLSNG
jgi:hypothetical protein